MAIKQLKNITLEEKEDKFDRISFYLDFFKNLTPDEFDIHKKGNEIIITIPHKRENQDDTMKEGEYSDREDSDLNTNESLRDWFKKEKWVRISSSGNIAGDCGTSKNKKNPDRCLPKAKAQSLTKGQRAATAAKKKKAGSKGKTVVKNTKKAKVTKEAFTPSPLQKLVNDYLFLITMNFIHIEKTGKSDKDVEELVKMIKHTKSDTDKLMDLTNVQLEKNRNSILKRIHDMLNYIISRMKAHMRPEEYEKRRGRLKQLLTLYKQAAKTQENFTGIPMEGLWANINAKKKAGKKSSHKNSNAYKAAKKAGTSLEKTKEGVTTEDIKNLVIGMLHETANENTIMEKDDRCTRLAKQKYDTWPSAYASGAVVRCRRGDIWKKK